MDMSEFCNAFPLEYTDSCEGLWKFLPGVRKISICNFSAIVNNERIVIPARIYFDCNLEDFHKLDARSQSMLFCFFTRHLDGYVREKCVRHIFEKAYFEPFVIPYILKLAEGYVIQIVEFVRESFSMIPPGLLKSFMRENPKWLALMHSRCGSYWDCYHRVKYRRFEDYPGTVLLNHLYKLNRENVEL